MKDKIRKGIAVLGLMGVTAAAMAGCKTGGKTPESQAVTDMPVLWKRKIPHRECRIVTRRLK